MVVTRSGAPPPCPPLEMIEFTGATESQNDLVFIGDPLPARIFRMIVKIGVVRLLDLIQSNNVGNADGSNLCRGSPSFYQYWYC